MYGYPVAGGGDDDVWSSDLCMVGGGEYYAGWS